MCKQKFFRFELNLQYLQSSQLRFIKTLHHNKKFVSVLDKK